MKSNAIPLRNKQGIRLYSKISEEPWWLASRTNKIEPEGWIFEPDINSVIYCADLPEISMSELPDEYFGEIILAESISGVLNRWINDESDLEFPQVYDNNLYRMLIIPAHNGETEIEKVNYAKLNNQTVKFDSNIVVSYRVSFTSFQSYFGFRFISIKDPGDYFDVRFYKDKCQVSYHVFEDNHEIAPTNSFPFQNNLCYSMNDSLIVLSLFKNNNGNKIISGSYQDEKLPIFELVDAESRFDEMEFVIITSQARLEIDYVLLTLE